MYIDSFNSFLLYCHYIMLISLIRFTAKPISCYTCLNCTKGNQNVIDGCGGCVVSSNISA